MQEQLLQSESWYRTSKQLSNGKKNAVRGVPGLLQCVRSVTASMESENPFPFPLIICGKYLRGSSHAIVRNHRQEGMLRREFGLIWNLGGMNAAPKRQNISVVDNSPPESGGQSGGPAPRSISATLKGRLSSRSGYVMSCVRYQR